MLNPKPVVSFLHSEEQFLRNINSTIFTLISEISKLKQISSSIKNLDKPKTIVRKFHLQKEI